MSGYFNNLSLQLFQKPLQNCTVAEVESLARNYPYFAPAQYLFLKKLDPQSEEYGHQFQRSILFYSDPLAFDFFIQNEHYITEFEVSDNDPEVLHPELESRLHFKPVEEDPFIASTENNVSNTNSFDTHLSGVTEAKTIELEPTSEEIISPEPVTPTQENSVAETTPELTFEPFHTVDYFASQGIKLSQEEATNDRVGKQLKSFTEWLKTMKRLPAKELVCNIPESGGDKVVSLAEHSVKNPEVVTEAMAEVWLKQGNSEKAVDVYNKLSLLNPSKRAYFAAKIDHLKNSI